ncbi:DUF2076 domain-containing protein [Bradyrhizobium lablabi]|uniref:DUF2076 domain-containing protein n=1 Tax=Bradyrhizobium lablabi TaxID=722472 RepID=UPI001BA4E2F9|nr:DUF2076 domain-containing protein [Bradyrhizobium lablabi]MBR1125759.1 DUF2076 domain-containing protein [Bradyrhizobium lablabi]
MTPQERQLIDDLFDRLSKLENSPRDPDAQAVIADGLRKAPNATYALVQTVLVQDEALKRAHERIQELEGVAQEQRQPGGFLDSMRESIFGQGQGQRGSVPNVRAPDMAGGDRPVWNSGQVIGQGAGQGPGQYGGGYGQQPGGYGQPYGGQQPPPMPGGGGGGSFLGTAAAAAAGVVGGSLLLGSIRSMMGGGHQQSFGDSAGLGGGIEDRRPNQSDSDLSREAGINDIGSRGRDDSGSRQGMVDQQASNDSYNDGYDDDDDMDHDSDGFDDDGDGGSDYA